MSLTVKHLNADASFLLTFSPSPEDCQYAQFPSPHCQSSNSLSASAPSKDFVILLDPWLIGGSAIYHPKFSYTTHRDTPALTSLSDLPEPDIVIISQPKSDHCNEPTLRTLPATGTKTIILAEPAAAKIIRSWKYFDASKIVAMKPYTAPIRRKSNAGRRTYVKNKTLQRILIPALAPGGLHGEVTVAYVPQKLDLTGLHNAVGITYRPPTASSRPSTTLHIPLTPPDSPDMSRQASPRVSETSTFSSPSTSSFVSIAAQQDSSRPLSVLFSPHGVSLASLSTYIQHQLTPYTPDASAQPAPLTCLLHCFDAVSNPWYLGGDICSGYPTGREIALHLRAKCWVSAHDEEKRTTGMATKLITTDRYSVEDVKHGITREEHGTEVRVLGVGEEIVL